MPSHNPKDWAPQFRLSYISPEAAAAFERVCSESYRKHTEAQEALTEKQFTEALAQALACGDFLMHVRIDNGAQAVTYVPYRECERLKVRIRELEAELVREQDAQLDSDKL